MQIKIVKTNEDLKLMDITEAIKYKYVLVKYSTSWYVRIEDKENGAYLDLDINSMKFEDKFEDRIAHLEQFSCSLTNEIHVFNDISAFYKKLAEITAF